jgi:sec-independent protein translocase protein TatA
MGFGWQELLIILVIVVIIFGGAKLAGLGKASGRAIREFKDEIGGGKTQATVEDPSKPAIAGLVYQAPEQPAPAPSVVEVTPPGKADPA